jgi:chorismate mutase
MSTTGLEPLRARIDDLDRQITALLADRLQVCAEVATYKRQHAIPMMQPDRVEAVKDRCAALGASKGLRAEFVRELYGRIIDEACRLEDEIIGAGDGVSGTDRPNV